MVGYYWQLLMGKKTNLSGWFKLKPAIIYHLKFAVKIL